MRKKEENEQVEKYTSNEIIDSIPSFEMKLMCNIQHILTSTEGDNDGDLEGDFDGDFDGLKVGLKGLDEGDLEGGLGPVGESVGESGSSVDCGSFDGD